MGKRLEGSCRGGGGLKPANSMISELGSMSKMLCAQARDASSDANGDKAGEGGLPPKKPHKPLAPIKSKASGK